MTDNNKDKELSYYAQGNELGASVEDAKGNKYTETRNEADGLTINYKDKYNQQLQSIKDNYKAFDLPYNGKDNDDYVNGQVCLKDIVGCTRESLSKLTFLSFARQFCCNDGTPEAAQARAMARTRVANGNFKPNDDYEKMQFYYHPDHLGSSSYITNYDRSKRWKNAKESICNG